MCCLERHSTPGQDKNNTPNLGLKMTQHWLRAALSLDQEFFLYITLCFLFFFCCFFFYWTYISLHISKVLKVSNQAVDFSVLQDAYDHLTSRDPKKFWTSGQWMTERKGGSAVGEYSLRVNIMEDERSDPASCRLWISFVWWKELDSLSSRLWYFFENTP